MSLKMMILTNLRRVFKGSLNWLIPVFLNLFPIHILWRRKDLSTQEFLKQKKVNKQGLEAYEYSLFSQNGEDGILRYLFSEIGASSKTFLEFGFGVVQNNSLRLILKEGWGGVLIDGLGASVKAFNKALQKFGIPNVRAIQQFLDLQNLRATILDSGLPEQIDLLSIDVDGNDYWFWKDILSYLNPRVVVIEYNASLGPELPLVVPYDPFFAFHEKHPSGFYHGASLTALVRLAHEKGYALIGCDSKGVNAFFVRRDCLSSSVTEVLPAIAYRSNARRIKKAGSLEEQFRIIKDMPFIHVD
jgi:hypothetical protein